MILQIDFSRIFLVFVIDMMMAIFFLGLGWSILRRRKSRLNATFSGFYISIALGLLINAAYIIINEIFRSEPLALILYYISAFLIFYGPVFMLATNRILIHSEVAYSLKSELKLILLYALALGFMAVFYFFDGIEFNESTNWRPVWSLPYLIYTIIVVTVFTTIPTIGSSFKILTVMKDKMIKRRWAWLMIGLLGLYVYEYLVFITFYFNTDFLRMISSLYAITVILWVWLIYKGVKKE
ncbi:MAG: hypothetical protein ACTSP9_13535 [Promethearchaeota archaeon]